MEKWTFKECRISKLKKTFSLKKVEELPCLTLLLNSSYTPSELHENMLLWHQKNLKSNVQYWNEQELALYFIGPMLSLADFGNEEYFNVFNERSISATIQNIELSGKVDGMIAAGKEEPEQPYFCLQEYKRETDPDGDPMAQALGAMLAAQTQNEAHFPIYGAYVNGRNWFFLALEGKEYAISKQYNATEKTELFDIFRILNGLRLMLEAKFNTAI